MMASSKVDLLLIGKTGNGKSASGNSILRRKLFKSGGNISSVTHNIEYEVSAFHGRIIKVVDGPGVIDTRMNTEDGLKLVMSQMEKAIATNPKGYHAFLLVLKYGQRFTGEEQNAIVFLKKIFGENFVKEFCILLMTNGDTFHSESEETGQTFENWCNSQTRAFKSLLEECGHRIVLFDNLTKDEVIRNKQVRQLLSVVDQLSSKGQRYTDANFEMAREAREQILIEVREPLLKDESLQEISLIQQKLEQIQASEGLDTKQDILENLLVEAEALSMKMSNLDRETGILNAIMLNIKAMISTISDEIKFSVRSKHKLKEIEDEIQRKFLEDTERIRQHFEQKLLDERLEDKQKQEILKQQETEQEALKRQMDNERETKQREYVKTLERERLAQIRKIEEVVEEYLRIKKKSDEKMLKKVLDRVIMPLRKVTDIFKKKVLGL